MKLISITPHHSITVPGFRSGAGLSVDLTDAKWAGWQLHARGPAIFLVSPPGWDRGQQTQSSTRAVFELPRSACYCTWSFDAGDELDGVAKWSPPPAHPTKSSPARPPSAAVEGANPAVDALTPHADGQALSQKQEKKR